MNIRSFIPGKNACNVNSLLSGLVISFCIISFVLQKIRKNMKKQQKHRRHQRVETSNNDISNPGYGTSPDYSVGEEELCDCDDYNMDNEFDSYKK